MKIETTRAAVSIHSMSGDEKRCQRMRAEVTIARENAVGRPPENTPRATSVSLSAAAAADIRFERVVGEVCDVRAQEMSAARSALTSPAVRTPADCARSGAVEISDCAVEL